MLKLLSRLFVRDKFPYFPQLDAMDCGPACLQMVAKHYGKSVSMGQLRQYSAYSKKGVSLKGISVAAEQLGFKTLGAKVSVSQLKKAPLPLILYWQQYHFVVLYQIKNDRFYVADPAKGKLRLKEDEFLGYWANDRTDSEPKGIALLLEPRPGFNQQEFGDLPGEKSGASTKGLSYILSFLSPYRKYLFQLTLGLSVASLLLLSLPFLTQSIVDIGIGTGNISFVNLILIAQLAIIVSRTGIDFFRTWTLLNIGARINISIISDFLIRLMRLPISFFQTKIIGDLLQRVEDQARIERFLTNSVVNIIFSIITIFTFSFVLFYYSTRIFGVFLLGSIIYVGWILIFLRRRRTLDNELFNSMSINQNHLVQLMTGMQEIKLHNAERTMRWDWERVQAKLFKVQLRHLSLTQSQQIGAVFINESKNLIITYLAALSVIQGDLTLGMMLAVQFIVGQLNTPVNEIFSFIQSAQDAKISTERLAEIQDTTPEDTGEKLPVEEATFADLEFSNVSFAYPGTPNIAVLKNISFTIPRGSTTAIVGTSGSGKTTILKLLMKFYNPVSGTINYGHVDLRQLQSAGWRAKCGAVLQDGFMFNETLMKNIAIGEDQIDVTRVYSACEMANLTDFVRQLPLGFNTKFGVNGQGLSQGQKQRILIARAIYKNPNLLLFDEATNALDANNELQIMNNMASFFRKRTTVIVAHRLSTVKNADNIIVLEKGKIVENGTHLELVERRGAYYTLIQNQLELGN